MTESAARRQPLALVVLCGLPGTGKSTLARALAPELGARILDKDVVRRELFGDGVDYSREQDDRACAETYHRAAALAQSGEVPAVVLDGRTYTRPGSLDPVWELAREEGLRLFLLECVCSEAEALRRLAADRAAGRHLAANRDAALYRELRKAAVAVPGPVLRLETDREELSVLVARALDYVRST